MISDEIRNRIEASVIYKNQRIIAGIKEGNNTRIGRDSSSSQHVQSQENWSKNKMSNIWTCKFRVIKKWPNECVRKRRSTHAYKQCVYIWQNDTLQLNYNNIIMNETVTER